MPQTCPHCQMWLPRANETFCPQCQGDLGKPAEEDEADEEPAWHTRRRSPLEKAALVGNAIQFVPIIAIFVLIIGGLVYGLASAVARNEIGSIVGFLLVLVVFGGLLYAVAKNFVANTRK